MAEPGRLLLVLGGIRSGKSARAEHLALASGAAMVTYLATARPGDAEMAERIARHQERRGAYGSAWRTVEEPLRVPEAVADAGRFGCVLVECVALWVTNLLLDPAGTTDATILAAVEELAAVARRVTGPVVAVSAEVGLGLMPPNELARRFADVLGAANQRLAAGADEVYLCVAGLSVCLKGEGPPGIDGR